jgi:hypothetical protein
MFYQERSVKNLNIANHYFIYIAYISCILSNNL